MYLCLNRVFIQVSISVCVCVCVRDRVRQWVCALETPFALIFIEVSSDTP